MKDENVSWRLSMNNLKRAIYRFLRIIVAYVIVLLLRYILDYYTDLNIPVIIVPIISAVLNAVAKFFREQWGIDIKL
jgi:TRAP-type mannitol/chloroaromatic compound transport system permease large subunit